MLVYYLVMTQVIQYIDTARTEQEACNMLAWLATQVDYIGGRILEPVTRGWWEVGTGPESTTWGVQVFFQDAPEASWLPDGCRRVILLNSQRKQFGLA